VTSTTGTAQITVADNGPGVTSEQAAHVFERFYRTDTARNRARGGQGAAFHLRLPLAASVESET
jgi:two-component system, OmpR family, sensor kinase